MRKLNLGISLVLGWMLLFAAACTKEYHNYEHFIDKGPIVYPGRADTVYAFGGRERIMLKWATPSDQNITEYMVFWNFGHDSLSVPGEAHSGKDTVKVYINGLPQGAYGFNVFSYDKEGHRSVGTLASGSVYGDLFQSTIFNRAIRSFERNTLEQTLYVAWVGIEPGCVGTEWFYTNTSGEQQALFSRIADSTIIPYCDVTQPISYKSLFLPEHQAIDTFYTELKTL